MPVADTLSSIQNAAADQAANVQAMASAISDIGVQLLNLDPVSGPAFTSSINAIAGGYGQIGTVASLSGVTLSGVLDAPPGALRLDGSRGAGLDGVAGALQGQVSSALALADGSLLGTLGSAPSLPDEGETGFAGSLFAVGAPPAVVGGAAGEALTGVQSAPTDAPASAVTVSPVFDGAIPVPPGTPGTLAYTQGTLLDALTPAQTTAPTLLEVAPPSFTGGTVDAGSGPNILPVAAGARVSTLDYAPTTAPSATAISAPTMTAALPNAAAGPVILDARAGDLLAAPTLKSADAPSIAATAGDLAAYDSITPLVAQAVQGALDAYAAAAPEVQAAINDSVTAWAATYAPGYVTGLTGLQSALADVISGDAGALSVAIVDQFRTQAFNTVDDQARDNQRQIDRLFQSTGLESWDGVYQAAQAQSAMAAGDRKANAAAALAVEMAKIQIQHLQVCLGLSKDVSGLLLDGVLRMAVLFHAAEQTARAWGDSQAGRAVDDSASQVAVGNWGLEKLTAMLSRFDRLIALDRLALERFREEVSAAVANAGALAETSNANSAARNADANQSQASVAAYEAWRRAEQAAHAADVSQFGAQSDLIARLADHDRMVLALWQAGGDFVIRNGQLKVQAAEADAAVIQADTAQSRVVVDAYEALVNAQAKAHHAAVELYGADSDAVRALDGHNAVLLDAFKAAGALTIDNAKLELGRAEANAAVRNADARQSEVAINEYDAVVNAAEKSCRLALEKFSQDIAHLSAQIGIDQTAVSRFRAQAEVYAENAARLIEQYRANTDSRRADADATQAATAVFRESWQSNQAAFNAAAELYSGDRDKARLRLERGKQIIDAFRAQIEAVQADTQGRAALLREKLDGARLGWADGPIRAGEAAAAADAAALRGFGDFAQGHTAAQHVKAQVFNTAASTVANGIDAAATMGRAQSELQQRSTEALIQMMNSLARIFGDMASAWASNVHALASESEVTNN